jgi:hypothetical protein
MPNIHKTARGSHLDFDRLKLMNETTIAVGNAGLNARGDLVKGGRILKTKEQLMQETYNLSGNNVTKHAKVRESSNHIEPDPISSTIPEAPLPPTVPLDILNTPKETVTISQPALDEKPRGGLAEAVKKSQDIAAALQNQRKRI